MIIEAAYSINDKKQEANELTYFRYRTAIRGQHVPDDERSNE
jgi:hypothetical protein